MRPVNEIQTSVEKQCSTGDCKQIVQALVRYNDGQAAPENYCDLVVLSRLGGELVGGLIAYTHWNWLFVFMTPETSREPNCEGIFLTLRDGKITGKDYSRD